MEILSRTPSPFFKNFYLRIGFITNAKLFSFEELHFVLFFIYLYYEKKFIFLKWWLKL